MHNLTVQELRQRLGEETGRPVVVDVREHWERALCALPGSLHIPMGEIPARLAELPAATDLVVVCHHGVRSRHVAAFLEHNGFTRVYNLSGGVDAWAREIDRAMAVY